MSQFLPNINNKSEILILGSMPGAKSLEVQQYYAHPQNRFWRLMGLFCNMENLQDFDYQEKLQTLLKNKIALWDVIQSCERNGSLDSNIQNEIPNNIPDLLKQYSNIRVICINGNKVYSAFKKYFPEILEDYNCYKMPSTSPANAKYKLNDLYQEWQQVFLQKTSDLDVKLAILYLRIPNTKHNVFNIVCVERLELATFVRRLELLT